MPTDPVNLIAGGNQIRVFSRTGTVENVAVNAHTTFNVAKPTQYTRGSVTSTTTLSTHFNFIDDEGEQSHYSYPGGASLIRDGDRVSLVFAGCGSRQAWSAIVNHNSNRVIGIHQGHTFVYQAGAVWQVGCGFDRLRGTGVDRVVSAHINRFLPLRIGSERRDMTAPCRRKLEPHMTEPADPNHSNAVSRRQTGLNHRVEHGDAATEQWACFTCIQPVRNLHHARGFRSDGIGETTRHNQCVQARRIRESPYFDIADCWLSLLSSFSFERLHKSTDIRFDDHLLANDCFRFVGNVPNRWQAFGFPCRKHLREHIGQLVPHPHNESHRKHVRHDSAETQKDEGQRHSESQCYHVVQTGSERFKEMEKAPRPSPHLGAGSRSQVHRWSQ